MEPLITNDAVVFGLLIIILAAIFYTSNLKSFKKFYTIVPPLLLCYFIPGFLNWPLGIISGEESNLYFVASRYLLPASLILLCLSIDFKGIKQLGSKAIIMFLAATLGIVIGGPIALFAASAILPESVLSVSPDELWRGLSTIAGSWIGGGANQTAMKEIFEVKDDIFSSMIVVDVIVANIWMAFLLFGAGQSDKIDKILKADNSAITSLKNKVKEFRAKVNKIPTTTELFIMFAVGFGGVAIAHFGADILAPVFKNINEANDGWLVDKGLSLIHI